MTTAAELRAEARHLRALARTISDPVVLTELGLLIEALEQRVRARGNGDATAAPVPDLP